MNQNHVNLASLDLNLITALSALLEHRSVTVAARHVGRTQSAMSHSLTRLRDHFHDPILVRDGWTMQLTPFGERLRPRVEQAAQATRMLFENSVDFDPALSSAVIRIATPDLCTQLFTDFIGAVSRQAPSASVEFVEASSVRQSVLNSKADIGLVFGHPKANANLSVHPLAALDWCTFTPRGHAYATQQSRQVWSDAHHIVVGSSGGTAGPIDKAMRKRGIERRVLCYATNFSSALCLAAEHNALFTTVRAPFEQAAGQLGLVATPPPFDMARAPVSLLFRADHGDPYAIWLRKLCVEALT
ncbi:MAG: LysR family transcriptional regulator [Rhizobiaceae bacterium]|nr:LysR family transcriptional regulator [Hyphomicrobiales bacterium]NRB30862.1 LysR family transcriptional regulator [Rhizobiaceae bacterium]